MKTLLFILSVFSCAWADENILCAPSICKDVKCPDLHEKCVVQNSTYSGTILPAPSMCNCCQFCLEHLNEGDYCSIGTPSSPLPNTVCGPGLGCIPSDAESRDGICAKIHSKCTEKQDDYDKRRHDGTLGQMEMRQDCDGDGYFASYRCIPGQTCYCVNKEGKRIFGEADFTGVPEADMKCRCSRDYAQIVSVIGQELGPSQHFRCKANGDYDTLQCIDDLCLCVDAEDGAPTYPEDPVVNITLMAKSTLNCYNKTAYRNGYYKMCEIEYMEVLEEVNHYKSLGISRILNYVFPKCDLDGSYQAVQENATHKICVDKEGVPLLAIDKSADQLAATTMNCKCIRALSVMSSRTERPSCAPNGNYETVQCRRGVCRCVDENGEQVCDNQDCEKDENENEMGHLQCPESVALNYRKK